jgi:hypothetical protein
MMAASASKLAEQNVRVIVIDVFSCLFADNVERLFVGYARVVANGPVNR